MTNTLNDSTFSPVNPVDLTSAFHDNARNFWQSMNPTQDRKAFVITKEKFNNMVNSTNTISILPSTRFGSVIVKKKYLKFTLNNFNSNQFNFEAIWQLITETRRKSIYDIFTLKNFSDILFGINRNESVVKNEIFKNTFTIPSYISLAINIVRLQDVLDDGGLNLNLPPKDGICIEVCKIDFKNTYYFVVSLFSFDDRNNAAVEQIIQDEFGIIDYGLITPYPFGPGGPGANSGLKIPGGA